MPKLSDAQIVEALKALPGWEYSGGTIHKKFALPGFPDAIAFVVRAAFLAEAADHHPDITVNWRWVTMSLVTHDQGGVTEKDMEMAGKIERLQ